MSAGYRPEIDGLRAIAVLAVVVYHAWPALLPGGFVGVDVFFVISGYLITALLADEWDGQRRIDLAAFYARRIRRLWPALIVVVLAVVCAGVWLLGRDGPAYHELLDSATASLLFAGNFHFEARTGGYFDAPAGTMPLLHLWSLAVEEQYYLAYPLLLPLLLRSGRRRAGLMLAGLGALSLVLAEAWLRSTPERAFFQMPARFWELALGGVVALTAADASSRRAGWLVGGGLGLIATACIATPVLRHFPGVGALPAVVGAALVLLAVHRSQPVGRFAVSLRSPLMVRLGLLSYSLYLWHWPLLAFDEALHMDPQSTGRRLLLCALACGLAWLSWRFVEQPLRRRDASVRRTLLHGAAATTLALFAVTMLGRLEMTPPQARELAARARADRPPAVDGCHFGMDARVGALKPVSCQSDPARPARLLIWGDSHALAWQPFAWAMARQQGVAAASITMDSCPPLAGEPPPEQQAHPRHAANCTRLSELALARLRSGEIDTLVLAQRWPLAISDPEGAAHADEVARRMRGLEAVLAQVGTMRIWLIGPVVGIKREAARCISTGREEQCAWTRTQVDAAVAPIWTGLRALAARHPNVTLIDPRPYLCDDERCPVRRDGRPLYWDDDHVAASAAAEFHRRYGDDPAQYTVSPADPAAAPERP